MKFLGDITFLDQGRSRFYNFTLEDVDTLPSLQSVEFGRMLFDKNDNSLKYNNGSNWTGLATQPELNTVENSLGFVDNDGSFNFSVLNALNTVSGLDINSSLLSALTQMDDFLAQSITINNDSTPISVQLGDTITIDGGRGLTTTVVGQTLTLDVDITHTYTSVTESTIHYVEHNLQYQYCNVVVVDSNNQMILPESVTFVDINNLTVTFSTARHCKIIVVGVNT